MKKQIYPSVKFILNEKIDTQYALNFAKQSSEKNDGFTKIFFPTHLHFIFNKEFSPKEQEKILKQYIKSFYFLNKKRIEGQYKLAKSSWQKKEKRYFILIDKIFKKHPWPKGDYTGFGTIFFCYPRFLDSKNFLFPLNLKRVGVAENVVGHELLHFIFFDYIQQKYNLNEKSKIKEKDSHYVWRVSEAFNSVVEGWKPYQKTLNSNPNPYPETIKMYRKMKCVWEKTENIDAVLLSVFPHLKD